MKIRVSPAEVQKNPALVGYARVSTADQNLDMQIRALKAAGCGHIFTDQGFSGATRSRPGLNLALRCLNSGGKLVVWRLDRLGRSLVHLVELMEGLGRDDIGFYSITENIDTSSPGGKLVFHFMAALAEFERSLISERTKAGMAAARLRGAAIGRPSTVQTSRHSEVQQLVLDAGWTAAQIADHLGIHPRTARRLISKLCSPPPSEVGVGR